jgi:hypothetical protein
MFKYLISITLLFLSFSVYVLGSDSERKGLIQYNTDEGNIEGVVYNPEGNTIPNASIAILDPESLDLLTGAATSADGSFSIELEPGNYLVRISYLSFETYEREIELQEGDSYDVGEIHLKEASRHLMKLLLKQMSWIWK